MDFKRAKKRLELKDWIQEYEDGKYSKNKVNNDNYKKYKRELGDLEETASIEDYKERKKDPDYEEKVRLKKEARKKALNKIK